jgi:hypothetical protein
MIVQHVIGGVTSVKSALQMYYKMMLVRRVLMKQISPQLLRDEVMRAVNRERDRQNEKWGNQRHPDGTWLMIIGEEYGEVCQAMQTEMEWGKPTDSGDKYTELIQLAAAVISAAEQELEERMLNKRIDTYA